MNYDLILQNVAKHIRLNEAEAGFFTSLLEHKAIRRKEYLLRQGEVCRTENFIIKGCTRTYTIDNNGLEHILMFGVEDWWVGDLSSFLTRQPANYFIDALEDTEVLQITRPNIDLLYEKIPGLNAFSGSLFKRHTLPRKHASSRIFPILPSSATWLLCNAIPIWNSVFLKNR